MRCGNSCVNFDIAFLKVALGHMKVSPMRSYPSTYMLSTYVSRSHLLKGAKFDFTRTSIFVASLPD